MKNIYNIFISFLVNLKNISYNLFVQRPLEYIRSLFSFLKSNKPSKESSEPSTFSKAPIESNKTASQEIIAQLSNLNDTFAEICFGFENILRKATVIQNRIEPIQVITKKLHINFDDFFSFMRENGIIERTYANDLSDLSKAVTFAIEEQVHGEILHYRATLGYKLKALIDDINSFLTLNSDLIGIEHLKRIYDELLLLEKELVSSNLNIYSTKIVEKNFLLRQRINSYILYKKKIKLIEPKNSEKELLESQKYKKIINDDIISFHQWLNQNPCMDKSMVTKVLKIKDNFVTYALSIKESFALQDHTVDSIIKKLPANVQAQLEEQKQSENLNVLDTIKKITKDNIQDEG